MKPGEEDGTRMTPPVKGPARSTSSDWAEPNTHPVADSKAGGEGAVVNVGKGAGRQGGKKEANVKVW